MNDTLESWISDILRDDLVVDPGNVSHETKENYWSFSFPEDESITLDAVVEFFEAILKRRSEQVLGKMAFYVWYDEMSHHLCFCLASVTKEMLPFGCSVIHAETLHEVVCQYFSSDSGGFIPNEELEELSLEEAFAEEEEEVQYKLKVWCKELSGRLNS